MKALVLEGSKLYHQLLGQLLGEQNIVADAVDQLSSAKSLLQKNHYDLVCSNEHLKDGNGVEFIEYLRSIPQYRTVPILYCTSQDDLNPV